MFVIASIRKPFKNTQELCFTPYQVILFVKLSHKVPLVKTNLKKDRIMCRSLREVD